MGIAIKKTKRGGENINKGERERENREREW